MLYGDLEGQNKVYDSEGILIPLENESLMVTPKKSRNIAN
jgi:hypothetical protein